MAPASATPGRWSTAFSLEEDLGSAPRVHSLALAIITDPSTALGCCKHRVNISHCLPVVVVRKGGRPDARGGVLSDDVEKDLEVASETV